MQTEQISVVMYPDGRLDTKNAARYLGLAEKTLAMMRGSGTGPKFVKRGRVFYFRDRLDEWIREGEASSTTQARATSRKEGRPCRDASTRY